MLDSWLDFHRATLVTKCERLTDEQLKTRSVPPSSLSLLGLVRHMTEVERNWFRRVLGAEDATALYCSDENKDGDFDDMEAADVAGDMARFREELDRCRRVAAEHPDLDTIRRLPPRVHRRGHRGLILSSDARQAVDQSLLARLTPHHGEQARVVLGRDDVGDLAYESRVGQLQQHGRREVGTGGEAAGAVPHGE
jgi:hypothetical protein